MKKRKSTAATDSRRALWTRERAVVAGIRGFGALFAAGWAMSKVNKRKSGPCSR